jgi:hypothetical protein
MPAMRRKERSGPGMVTLVADVAAGFGTSADGTVVVEVSDEEFEAALQTLTGRQRPK